MSGKTLRAPWAWLLLAALAAIAARPSPAAAGPIRVVDFNGREIALPAPARRVVCLMESALSGLFMLGAQSSVVGVSRNVYQGRAFRYYAAMDKRIASRALPAPGNWDFVNLESVVALQPDLVIIWSHQEESIAALRARGIPVYGVFIKSFVDVYREMRDLGALTGRRQRADALVRLARGELGKLAQLLETARPEKRPGVYFMWSQGLLETSGGPSTVNQLIELAGGANVARGVKREHLLVNLERLLAWNPQVIVMWPSARRGPAQVLALPAWKSIDAVANGRVHQLPEAFSCDLWTLKFVHAVLLMAKWCHPGPLSGLHPARRRGELLRALYGPTIGPALEHAPRGK